MNTKPALSVLVFALTITLCPPAAAQAQAPRTKESVARDLNEVARASSVMIDGDVCERIMTKRSLERMFVVDPKDPWAASDDFNVNHEPYIQTKKTLIRLSRLVDFPCDVNLWMPFRDNPAKIQILIRNVHELSQFWVWGQLTQNMIPEMKKVLETGERVTVMRKTGMVSVLAPVFDSLGNIVGLIEAVAMDPGIPLAPVHARSGDPGIATPVAGGRR